MNNTPGAGGEGTEGLPEDLKRLLARAETQNDDGETVGYDPDAVDEDEEDDDEELEESFGTVDRGEDAGEDINGGSLQISEFGHEMKQSFIEYSMSVITARALPDVRDGLKPVHRRILYAMNESGIYPNRPHKKSAWTVGEVIGKYHPHGDAAVYDTMVRLAQWFSMRTPLIDGHGNFGNIDGDGAAAMRYTESRLAKPAMELLRDLQKDTVDWQPNYDESLAEPQVLPARFPNLLVNGSSGIAVGMATNIPPHNLAEAVEATCMLIDNPDATTEELMTVMPGPDFPTGARIMGSDGIRQAYETGRGSITVRAKAHVESTKTGRNRLVFTEIPYQVNKGNLQEKIAQLVNEKRIEGISDMRDESTQKGIRLVIELKKGVIPQVVLNNLYKYTSLQNTFGVNNLALVNGVPKCLSLRDMLRCYIDHQVDVVTRRTRFDLKKAQARAHILEGYLLALDHIDEVISIIRSSRTDSEASARLIERFGFSPEQTTAILEMKLRRLTGLERDKIQEELDGLRRAIAYYEDLLAHEEKILGVIKEEMREISRKYGDKRRTEICAAERDLDVEDLIADEDMVVTITHTGYVKRIPVAAYRAQKRGGKGVTGANLKEDDVIDEMFIASTHEYVLFFSNRGKVYRLKVHELPVGTRQARGTAIVNLLPFEEGEKIASVISCREFPDNEYLMFATASGMVKKTVMSAYDRSRRDGIIAINLKNGDHLLDVRRVREGDKVILATTAGKAIMFSEEQVRATGRDTSGVRGITMKGETTVLGMEISNGRGDLFVITERGFGKRTPIADYPEQNRGGQGVYTIQMTDKKGNLAAMKTVGPQHELFIITEGATVIRVKTEEISKTGRATQGVKMMTVADGDRVCAVARMTSAKKKPKAPAVAEGQESLDLAAAGALEAPSDDHVDIGSGDEALEDLMDE
ncbi:DNA gyrase subunit A [Collinsella ihumii]|uniref:DNA gyrase subunit A n=1 Tax=Collinsella ihumii TaxID=1720204 RepID=A0AAW7JVM9_9ACTN|nr:DNA gyrase subunit A [Collinsella ihumii]MBM6904738.1 DNA gyrase subunit A [Collinsella tanakaei]MDN0056548.1 DNA gyrase subunit A [Collinsella ihumii]MDN0068898.1 DNA gyrase subunit A [Collinsella ihumii]